MNWQKVFSGCKDEQTGSSPLSEHAAVLREEARRRYLALRERHGRGLPLRIADECEAEKERLREDARRRFLIANRSATDQDFDAYWPTILDELSRQRSRRMLDELRSRSLGTPIDD